MIRSRAVLVGWIGVCSVIACGTSISGQRSGSGDGDGDDSQESMGGLDGQETSRGGDESDGPSSGETGTGGTSSGGNDSTGSGGMVQPPPETCNHSDQCTFEVPICDSDSAECRVCDGDDECAGLSGTAPFCAEGSCVACRDAGDCSTDLPFCGAGGQCRACQAHDECESLACDLDSGQCIVENKIVYILAQTGASTNCGTIDIPCYGQYPAVPQLSASRNYLVLKPTTATMTDIGGIVLPAIEGLVVIGHGVVVAPADDEPSLTLSGGSATVDGVTFESTNQGIHCTGGSLTVRRSRFENTLAGVWASACDVDVKESTFIDNDTGIHAEGLAEATIERNWIEGGLRGLYLSNTQFRVVNNIIANHAATYSFDATAYLSVSEPSVFSFNTLYNNTAAQGYNGIVYAVGSPLTISSNISFENCGEAASCKEFTSLEDSNFSHNFTAIPFPGANNASGDPLFESASTGDFGLSAESPAIDGGNPVGAPEVDYFGNPRTVGEAPDCGAIERGF